VFKHKKKTIKVTNLHLEYAGDRKVRSSQLNYLLGVISKIKYDVDILLGDFNTFGKIDRNIPELAVLKDAGYRLVSKDIKYTADASSPDPNWYPYPILKFLTGLGFRLHQNLDHVLLKGDVKA